jgi:alanyl-tRNA synthetase
MLMTDGVTPGQRGARLHPAPAAAPRDPRDAPARRRLDELRRSCSRHPGSRCATPYPDVEENWERTSRLALGEEEAFIGTLASGTRSSTRRREDAQGGRQTLPGDTTFLLHDTFGFPIDLTLEIARRRA